MQTRQDDGAIANESLSFTARNAGMLLVIYSQFLFASMDISVKLLNGLDPPVHALQIIVIRMGITLICCEIYMTIMGIPDPIAGPKGVRMMLFIRGVTGFFGISGMYWSLQYLSVADATVLVFLTPLTAAVAGSIFLKESYSVKQAIAGIFSLLGVVLIGRPAFLFGSLDVVTQGLSDVAPAQRLVGVVACMVSVLGNTGAYTSIRTIGKRAHPMHVMSYFSLWCTIMSSLGMVVFDIPVVYPTSWMWILLLLMVGVFGFAAQVHSLTMGLQRETVSRGVTGMYAQVVFVVVLERLFFGVTPSLPSVLGAAIIMSSAFYVVVSGYCARCYQTSVLM
ncbi:drug/metabolite transporter superfamily [Suillus tomentosus]|nr:drug/metabolite transporter superfamily [Suillus tomentosus]